MKRLGDLQTQFTTQSEDMSVLCQQLMNHACVNTETVAAVDDCVRIERASAQSISAKRLTLIDLGFAMRQCGFTVQNDKMAAALPQLEQQWADVKRSVLQSQNAVVAAVAQQIQGAQEVITEAVGTGFALSNSQNNHTHTILNQLLQLVQNGRGTANAPEERLNHCTSMSYLPYQPFTPLTGMPYQSCTADTGMPYPSFAASGMPHESFTASADCTGMHPLSPPLIPDTLYMSYAPEEPDDLLCHSPEIFVSTGLHHSDSISDHFFATDHTFCTDLISVTPQTSEVVGQISTGLHESISDHFFAADHTGADLTVTPRCSQKEHCSQRQNRPPATGSENSPHPAGQPQQKYCRKDLSGRRALATIQNRQATSCAAAGISKHTNSAAAGSPHNTNTDERRRLSMLPTPNRASTVLSPSAPLPEVAVRPSNDSELTSSVIFSVGDTEWDQNRDVYDIACIKMRGNGDIVTPVVQMLIQPTDVHCPRMFGKQITAEQLMRAPTFEDSYERLTTEFFDEDATVIFWGFPGDNAVHQDNARRSNRADFKYEGLCGLKMVRRLREAGTLVCIDCTQENVAVGLGLNVGLGAHEAEADAIVCAKVWAEMLHRARTIHHVYTMRQLRRLINDGRWPLRSPMCVDTAVEALHTTDAQRPVGNVAKRPASQIALHIAECDSNPEPAGDSANDIDDDVIEVASKRDKDKRKAADLARGMYQLAMAEILRQEVVKARLSSQATETADKWFARITSAEQKGPRRGKCLLGAKTGRLLTVKGQNTHTCKYTVAHMRACD
jgi:hypothetical protein